MRQVCIFSGSSHPRLVDAICDRLGQKPAKVELKKFSNGETSVEIKTSVRDRDVFIVQTGSSQINDNVMELLIMISACKGGSARSITAVMPYFPYSRQSKKKAHRGAITARMLANLMKNAGVNHVITIDLHASQMQGFFKCPVDNLFAEPLLGKWIRMNIPEWSESVVVSKNPGGTKRVTSLADRLGLSFGIVTTDRRRPRYSPSMVNSVLMESLNSEITNDERAAEEDQTDNSRDSPPRRDAQQGRGAPLEHDFAPQHYTNGHSRSGSAGESRTSSRPRAGTDRPGAILSVNTRSRLSNGDVRSSPLAQSSHPDSSDEGDSRDELAARLRQHSIRSARATRISPQNTDEDGYEEPEGEDNTDERARDVITGRLIHGHIVDDDVPSPALSMYSTAGAGGQQRSSDDEDPMMQSFISTASSRWNATNGNNPSTQNGLGGSGDATASDDEEEEALQNPEFETRITLVGNVRDKPVIIVDDMIDKAGSWVAAAETVVKRGGATKVYCMATHGLFGGDSLRQLDECDEIDKVIVTDAFSISEEDQQNTKKLVVLDVSALLAEAIRRNHHGESISQLYHLWD